MSRVMDAEKAAAARFPRVSGDEPWVLSFRSASDAFSPREWG